ncbi:hypothetical protein PFISCL1PPCAC_16321, partial [Pristionchus fissidentatus]
IFRSVETPESVRLSGVQAFRTALDSAPSNMDPVYQYADAISDGLALLEAVHIQVYEKVRPDLRFLAVPFSHLRKGTIKGDYYVIPESTMTLSTVYTGLPYPIVWNVRRLEKVRVDDMGQITMDEESTSLLDLPDEILCMILSYLSFKSRMSVHNVNRRMRSVHYKAKRTPPSLLDLPDEILSMIIIIILLNFSFIIFAESIRNRPANEEGGVEFTRLPGNSDLTLNLRGPQSKTMLKRVASLTRIVHLAFGLNADVSYSLLLELYSLLPKLTITDDLLFFDYREEMRVPVFNYAPLHAFLTENDYPLNMVSVMTPMEVQLEQIHDLRPIVQQRNIEDFEMTFVNAAVAIRFITDAMGVDPSYVMNPREFDPSKLRTSITDDKIFIRKQDDKRDGRIYRRDGEIVTSIERTSNSSPYFCIFMCRDLNIQYSDEIIRFQN